MANVPHVGLKTQERGVKKLELEERRRRVLMLYTSRVPAEEIAAAVRVSVQTVRRDIRIIRERYQREAMGHYRDWLAQELMDLESMEKDAAMKLASTGDPRWHDQRLKVKALRAKLLGVGTPEIAVQIWARGQEDSGAAGVDRFLQTLAEHNPKLYSDVLAEFADMVRVGALRLENAGEVGEVGDVIDADYIVQGQDGGG